MLTEPSKSEGDLLALFNLMTNKRCCAYLNMDTEPLLIQSDGVFLYKNSERVNVSVLRGSLMHTGPEYQSDCFQCMFPTHNLIQLESSQLVM